MIDHVLIELARTWAVLSLIAIGGINTVIPEVYHQSVVVQRWITDAEFGNLLAISQTSPGPNGLVVSLIGWRVAGLAGFLVSTAAVQLPPAAVAFALSRLRQRLGAESWLGTAQSGLVPIAIGLILASGYVTAVAVDRTIAAVATTIIVSVVVWRTRLNPMWLLGCGALVGILGS
ncbi:MAG: chromate transporter [Chloroflexota bacterium]